MTTITWSVTRSNRYSKCPRAFYFNDIRKGDECPEIIAPTLPQIVGIAVHESIEREIGQWSRGQGYNAQRVLDNAVNVIQSHVDGLDIETLSWGNHKRKDAIEAAVRHTRNLLISFSKLIWPAYQKHRYISHEMSEVLEIGKNKAIVKADLVTESPAGVMVISDWKTSRRPHLDEEWIQLAAYILWAERKFRRDPGSIEGRIVSLSAGPPRNLRGSDELLHEIHNRIVNETSMWSSGDPERFQPSPDESRCKRCPYLDECDEGLSSVEHGLL